MADRLTERQVGDAHDEAAEGPLEIGLIGDLTENESDIVDKLLAIPPGGEGTLYIDSPGGSAYCALGLMSLIRLRGLQITGVVIGECSSAALWPFAACHTRLVTPFSVLLFHPMKWQSEEHVQLAEAAEWARHFGLLESEMDRALADLFGMSVELLQQWTRPGRYVSGQEFVAAGLGHMVKLDVLPHLNTEGDGAAGSGGKRGSSA